ncbi:hypothetical protein RDI58_014156 [Solanum bulbocastanum]|uniref:Uncharacterized protein n=1 Tax=Solanum bulbocastanum TaxID=147425 RepID=A0AAN8TUS6_SOLBU
MFLSLLVLLFIMHILREGRLSHVQKVWFFVLRLSIGSLAGAALLAPVINSWWPGFPETSLNNHLMSSYLETNGLIELYTMPHGLCIGGTHNNIFMDLVL